MSEPERGGALRPLKFSSTRRITRRRDFLRVYETGRRVSGRFATIFCLGRESVEGGGPQVWRLGITATRKSGNAVERNRQKRRVREFFRLNQDWISEGWDFVVNTRASLTSAPNEELIADLSRSLGKLGIRPATLGESSC